MVGGSSSWSGCRSPHVSLRWSLPRAPLEWHNALGVVFLIIAQIWAWLVIFRHDTEASLFARSGLDQRRRRRLWDRHPLYMGGGLDGVDLRVLVVGGQTCGSIIEESAKGGGDSVTTITRHPGAEEVRRIEEFLHGKSSTLRRPGINRTTSDFDTDDEHGAPASAVMQRFTVVGFTGREGMPFSASCSRRKARKPRIRRHVHRGFSVRILPPKRK